MPSAPPDLLALILGRLGLTQPNGLANETFLTIMSILRAILVGLAGVPTCIA